MAVQCNPYYYRQILVQLTALVTDITIMKCINGKCQDLLFLAKTAVSYRGMRLSRNSAAISYQYFFRLESQKCVCVRACARVCVVIARLVIESSYGVCTSGTLKGEPWHNSLIRQETNIHLLLLTQEYK